MRQLTSPRQFAVNARKAIRLLNCPVAMKECLPGEPEGPGCGLDERMHVVAYLAVLRAMTEHYLSHAAGPEADGILEEMHKDAAAMMTEHCGAC